MPTFLPPRLGISQSEALAEASAFATANEPVLLTLAFTHPDITDPETGEQIGIYVVNDYEDLMATLDGDAPLDAGQEVRFIAVPMEVTLPTEEDDAPQGEVKITISNVSRMLMPYLEAVSQSSEPVLIIARTYLPSDTTEPHESPPLRVTLRGATVTTRSVTAMAGYGDTTNRRYPSIEYTQQTFKALTS